MLEVSSLQRFSRLVAALLIVFASVLSLFAQYRTASAHIMLGDREIRMSTAEVDATGVSYRVDFDVTVDDDIGGIVVTFCEETPIIGDSSCAVPAGFSLAGGSVSGADEGDVDLSSFNAAFSTESTGGTANNTLTFSNAAAVTPAASDAVIFTIEGATNPSAIETFYARIMVYETEAAAQGYSVGDINNPGQAGGIALSTADLLTIEAKVQERLTFCVFTDELVDPSDWETCENTTSQPVILGDDNGVLDSIAPSVSKDAKFNITTNTSTGATIRMKGTTLASGTFEIDPIGATPAASDEGTEQFGMCVYTDPASTDTIGLVPESPYDHVDCEGTNQGMGTGNDNGALFAFDAIETNSLYGHPIAIKAAGEWSTGVLVFLGNISNTTEPGIYTTTLDFIATGRY